MGHVDLKIGMKVKVISDDCNGCDEKCTFLGMTGTITNLENEEIEVQDFEHGNKHWCSGFKRKNLQIVSEDWDE